MTNLATIAANGQKVRKADAQQIIRDLAEQYPESVNDLAKLYAYFMPARPKKAKDGFAWVAQAAAKNDIRYYLNYVHVCEDFIAATDGHRVHRIANADGLPPGFYLANGDKAHEPAFAKFPDIERVIPRDHGDRKLVTVKIADLEVVKPGSKLTVYVLPGSEDGRVVWANKQYFDQATAGLDEVTLSVGGEQDSLRLDIEGKTTVMVPVRQD